MNISDLTTCKTELLIFIPKPVLPTVFLLLGNDNSILLVMPDEADHITFLDFSFFIYKVSIAPILNVSVKIKWANMM